MGFIFDNQCEHLFTFTTLWKAFMEELICRSSSFVLSALIFFSNLSVPCRPAHTNKAVMERTYCGCTHEGSVRPSLCFGAHCDTDVCGFKDLNLLHIWLNSQHRCLWGGLHHRQYIKDCHWDITDRFQTLCCFGVITLSFWMQLCWY